MQTQRQNILHGDAKLRGVNLGSWLVYESWMSAESPVYKAVPGEVGNRGELAICDNLGSKAADLFAQHRRTMITEDDIRQIKACGLNSVRIPVGWWTKGCQDSRVNPAGFCNRYAQGSLECLDSLANWCETHEIFMLISLHAHIGTQNGADHSAGTGSDQWSAYPENVADSLQTVQFLVDRYKSKLAFIGIGLCNEPSQSQNKDVLQKFYTDSYKVIRETCKSDCLISYMPRIMEQDLPSSGWKDFFAPPQFSGCMFEIHPYECFNPNLKSSLDIWNSVEYRKQSINNWKGNWLCAGEWSLAAPGSANINDQQDMVNFYKQQIDAMMPCKACFFWSWGMYADSSNTNLSGWSYKSLVKNKVVG